MFNEISTLSDLLLNSGEHTISRNQDSRLYLVFWLSKVLIDKFWLTVKGILAVFRQAHSHHDLFLKRMKPIPRLNISISIPE